MKVCARRVLEGSWQLLSTKQQEQGGAPRDLWHNNLLLRCPKSLPKRHCLRLSRTPSAKSLFLPEAPGMSTTCQMWGLGTVFQSAQSGLSLRFLSSSVSSSWPSAATPPPPNSHCNYPLPYDDIQGEYPNFSNDHVISTHLILGQEFPSW